VITQSQAAAAGRNPQVGVSLGSDADAMCETLTCDECFCYLADALVEALDSGTLQLERNGPIQKSARGIWMRYDFDAAGGDLHDGSLW